MKITRDLKQLKTMRANYFAAALLCIAFIISPVLAVNLEDDSDVVTLDEYISFGTVLYNDGFG